MSSRPPTPADLQPFIGQVSPPYFAPFPRLPVELRLAIWQRVEHGSLIIRINIERIIDGLTTYDRFGRASRPYTLKLKSCSTPPAMFHVNSEARNASINMHGYSKALESRLGGKYVWINWIRDAIYIPTPEILQAFCSSLGGALTPNVRDDLHAVRQNLQHLILGRCTKVVPGCLSVPQFTSLRIVNVGFGAHTPIQIQRYLNAWSLFLGIVWNRTHNLGARPAPLLWGLRVDELELLTGYRYVSHVQNRET